MAWWPENFTDLVVVISGIATAVLVVIVGRQLVITKREIESRQRPWISIRNMQATSYGFKDGSIENYDFIQDKISNGRELSKEEADDIKEVVFEIPIKNVGTTPATKVTYKFLKSSNEFAKEDLEKQEITDMGIIMAGEEDVYTYEVNIDDFDKRTHYFVGLLLEYKIDDKKDAKVGKMWEAYANTHEIIDEWI